MNVNVYVSAKEAYLDQLKIQLTPLLYEGFISLYDDAVQAEDSNPKFDGNHLMRFQTFLTDIPEWNQTILDNETDRIVESIDMFIELVGQYFYCKSKFYQ